MKEQTEKQAIEEMAKLACTCFNGNCKGCPFDFYPPCPPKASAKRIYNAGYRKQKKGFWKIIKPRRENRNATYICSVCGGLCSSYYNDVGAWKCCPNCGARMKGGAE